MNEGTAGRQPAGILGGTFDPVHLGHLNVADGVRTALGLARMFLVPCFRPPHKTNRAITEVGDRLAMLELAVQGRAGLNVSAVEIERGGLSYTIDTLCYFREVERIDPLFVLGVDALAELPTWREYHRLTREFDLVVVDRPGGSLADAVMMLDPESARRVVPVRGVGSEDAPATAPEPGSGGRIFYLPLPLTGVSSRQIRALVAAHQPIDGLVHPAVARYIQERNLYA